MASRVETRRQMKIEKQKRHKKTIIALIALFIVMSLASYNVVSKNIDKKEALKEPVIDTSALIQKMIDKNKNINN